MEVTEIDLHWALLNDELMLAGGYDRVVSFLEQKLAVVSSDRAAFRVRSELENDNE